MKPRDNLPLILSVILSFIFTFSSIFLIFITPSMIDSVLKEYIDDPWYKVNKTQDFDQYQSYVDNLRAIIDILKPIGIICFIIISILIILGVILKKYKISILGSFSLYLPIFGWFSAAMTELYIGIGVIQLIWFPFLEINPELLNLAPILNFPFYLLIILMFIGFFLVFISTFTWVYGKFHKVEIINFWIYKYSRHPQYLGIICINQGMLFFTYQMHWVWIPPPTTILLILNLLIIGLAIQEENNLMKINDKYGNYREKVPFLFSVDRTIEQVITFPLRKIIKKDWPESNKEIILTLLIYGGICLFISIPLILF